MAKMSSTQLAKLEFRRDWLVDTIATMTSQGVEEYEINGRRVKKLSLLDELDQLNDLIDKSSATRRAVNLAKLRRG